MPHPKHILLQLSYPSDICKVIISRATQALKDGEDDGVIAFLGGVRSKNKNNRRDWLDGLFAVIRHDANFEISSKLVDAGLLQVLPPLLKQENDEGIEGQIYNILMLWMDVPAYAVELLNNGIISALAAAIHKQDRVHEAMLCLIVFTRKDYLSSVPEESLPNVLRDVKQMLKQIDSVIAHTSDVMTCNTACTIITHVEQAFHGIVYETTRNLFVHLKSLTHESYPFHVAAVEAYTEIMRGCKIRMHEESEKIMSNAHEGNGDTHHDHTGEVTKITSAWHRGNHHEAVNKEVQVAASG